MNIRHLKIFKTVCDEGSVTKAANQLYMTQPAVSHVLHEMETTLGYPLFDRINRRLYITAAGTLFLDKTRQVLAVYDELEKDAKQFELLATLRIGCCITIANFWLPDILQQLQKEDDIRVNVVVDQAANILHKLQHNEIDIAFIEGILPQGDYYKIPFSSYRLKLVCASSYRHQLNSLSKPEEVVKESFLLREKGSAIRDVLDSTCKLHQVEIEPRWTSVNSQALLQAARSGLGITLLPEMLVEQDLQQGILKEVKLSWLHLENQNYILYHKDKYISKPMQMMISLTRELFCK